jgi:hypothetical protein
MELMRRKGLSFTTFSVDQMNVIKGFFGTPSKSAELWYDALFSCIFVFSLKIIVSSVHCGDFFDDA